MKRELISVIVPYFNEERYIGECLKSLCNQTYPNVEIIAMDDGSTDKSSNIVESFRNVRSLSQPHAGPGIARNTAAREAHGNILVFVDADMKYDPNYITLLVEPIIHGGAVGTTHVNELVANPDALWSQCWSVNADLASDQRTHAHVRKKRKLNIFRAIRTDAFKKAGGFDVSKGYFDDVSLAAALGQSAQVIPQAIAYHYNPETLMDVFLSARWIGRSPVTKVSIENILRYNILNSVRNGMRKVLRGAPLAYILFKSVFDFGMLTGIIFRSNSNGSK